MTVFISEADIRQTIILLIEKYQVNKNMLIQFIGEESFAQINKMLVQLEEGEMDLSQLVRIIIINKGPYLFSGSNNVIRDLRAFLLRQLDDEILIDLYERNPISNRNIRSASHMPNALARKKWVMGGKWARDFVQTLGFPIVFSGISVPKDHSTDSIQDIEPRKTVPSLVDYQLELKDKMLAVLNLEQEKTRCVVTLPTGGGKTRVAVESFIDWMQPRFSEGKYLIWIAQSEELCEQAIACITDLWQDREFPEALRVYRFFGGKQINVENLIGGVVVASIQQLYTRNKSKDPALDEILENCGAMIIDEAHHATTKSYKSLFKRARQLVGDELFPICGLTATPGRSNDETMKLVDEFDAYLIHPTLPNIEKYQKNPLLYFREEGYLAEPIFLLSKDGETVEVPDEYIDNETDDINSEYLKVLAEDRERNFHIIEYMLTILLEHQH